jgi:hypothetical protein
MGKGKGCGRVSTAEDKVVRLGKDSLTGGEKRNLKKRRQMIECGQRRRIMDPRIFLEQDQKTFFIFRGEILSDLKLDLRIVVIVEVGHIQRNEER